jgi:hypothetical protein
MDRDIPQMLPNWRELLAPSGIPARQTRGTSRGDQCPARSVVWGDAAIWELLGESTPANAQNATLSGHRVCLRRAGAKLSIAGCRLLWRNGLLGAKTSQRRSDAEGGDVYGHSPFRTISL